MAIPSTNTRRGQIVFGGMLLFHLLIISGQVEAKSGQSLFVSVVFGALSPFQRAVSGAYFGIRDLVQRYADLRDLRDENARLSERLRSVETELNARRLSIAEADRLRAMLDLRQRLPFETIATEMVSAEGLPWASIITVNSGTRQGVALNAPAISRSGLLGRVIAVGPHAAKVQLIIDRDSGVGVLIERTGTLGVLEGVSGARGDLPLRYVPATADVRQGDTVVTSSLDRIYPKELLVGYVSRIQPGDGLLKEIYVTPAAQFDRLEEMLLLRVPLDSFETTETVR